MKRLFLASIGLVGVTLSACTFWQPPSVQPTTEDFLQALPKQTMTPLAPVTPQNTTAPIARSAVLQTSYGDIEVTFYQESPRTVANFVELAQSGFYNGVTFHRVIQGFMVQSGDPLSKDEDWSNDGQGGPGYTFDDEINQHKLVRGSLAMANAGPNTNGSQFFIVTAEATPWLDGKHTNFGYVSQGMDVVAKIEAAASNKNDHPLENITITSVVINE
ncbi:MAG: peptidylprolyl isomerase [Candidatus Veblenbacteria bacterium]|nr:peptidylprolyl isomerase [Candidatus Veblenbacteria bacterium]